MEKKKIDEILTFLSENDYDKLMNSNCELKKLMDMCKEFISFTEEEKITCKFRWPDDYYNQADFCRIYIPKSKLIERIIQEVEKNIESTSTIDNVNYFFNNLDIKYVCFLLNEDVLKKKYAENMNFLRKKTRGFYIKRLNQIDEKIYSDEVILEILDSLHSLDLSIKLPYLLAIKSEKNIIKALKEELDDLYYKMGIQVFPPFKYQLQINVLYLTLVYNKLSIFGKNEIKNELLDLHLIQPNKKSLIFNVWFEYYYLPFLSEKEVMSFILDEKKFYYEEMKMNQWHYSRKNGEINNENKYELFCIGFRHYNLGDHFRINYLDKLINCLDNLNYTVNTAISTSREHSPKLIWEIIDMIDFLQNPKLKLHYMRYLNDITVEFYSNGSHYSFPLLESNEYKNRRNFDITIPELSYIFRYSNPDDIADVLKERSIPIDKYDYYLGNKLSSENKVQFIKDYQYEHFLDNGKYQLFLLSKLEQRYVIEALPHLIYHINTKILFKILKKFNYNDIKEELSKSKIKKKEELMEKLKMNYYLKYTNMRSRLSTHNIMKVKKRTITKIN